MWPLKEKPVADIEKKPEEKPPEKSPAELIAESLKPVVEGFTQMRADIEELKNRTKPAEKPFKPAEMPSVLDGDEDAAFNARLSPLVAMQLELQARVVTTDVKNEYNALGFGELWKQFEADINQQLSSSPLVSPDGKILRGNPDYIRNVVDMIIGRAARQKGLRFNGSDNRFFLEDAGGSAEAARKSEELAGINEKQRKVFERMGVSLEDAKKTMSKLEFVS